MNQTIILIYSSNNIRPNLYFTHEIIWQMRVAEIWEYVLTVCPEKKRNFMLRHSHLMFIM
jgi:hypothetical protein